ncbi:hypothetical protein [Nodularia sphaerocarpa]|uniref:hypothetical protein n=1 Tax=Nodularia sphaerocarpa TaxID=137816 RepID=UPI001EFB244F|nr:hypothetical protein [Nodularia sphaerocarpa]MDB9372392.1 hypothetical protein [Nodularia sphaerocarpa CS-585]ULP71469.1 hypothetical protein BDGGKGIB_01095 [Nodularia sphaerocarpa UHCC 0038]ULP73403.1 hypothetical protein BDGGKGIB_03056 [Nodularia sphaerocarpa UHCC 0038]
MKNNYNTEYTAQKQVPENIQTDIYLTAKDTVTSAPLAVLLTLVTIGTVTAFFSNKFIHFINQEVWCHLKTYLISQGEAVKTFSETTKDTTKLLSQLDFESKSNKTEIINKLSEIETDVKIIKSLISK